MNNFITFSDSELEFLERLGVQKKDNIFCSSDNEYICTKANYGPLKAFGSLYKYATFQYEGKKGGTITFVRGNNSDNDLVPSLIFDYMGIIVAFDERTIDLYVGEKEDRTEEMDNILNNLKKVTIIIRNKRNKNNQLCVSLNPTDALGSTRTEITRTETKKYYESRAAARYALIKTNLSGIRCETGNVKTYDDISPECYEEVLKEAIETTFRDDQISINVYSLLAPLFSKSYEAALNLPAMNEKIIRDEIESDRNEAISNYDKIVSEADTKRREILESLASEEENLAKIIEKYPISRGKQK